MTISSKKLLSAVISAAMVLSLFVMPVAKAADIPGWQTHFSGGVKAEYTFDSNVVYSGSSSLKITCNSPAVGNVYTMMTTVLPLEKGKTYIVSLAAKSESTNLAYIAFNWGDGQTLTQFGETFDWTNFEYLYTANTTGNIELQLIVEGISKGLWIDEFKVVDRQTGKNLIENSNFELGGSEIETGEDATDASVQAIYDKVSNSERFTEAEMLKVRGAFKYMPVYRAEGITIDGNPEDWENFPSMTVPTLPNQYSVYMNDGRAKDVVSEAKFAYDDENFYLYIEVVDDVFYSLQGENDYWVGDSIQLAISSIDEVYGNEIGFIHNENTGSGEIYGRGFGEEQKEKITLKTSQEGNKTIYEASIPWNIKFSERPSQMYFNYLVNDNDGDGRRYCAELAPKGISEEKSNKNCPLLELQDSPKSVYGWVQGDRSGMTEDETSFDYYLVNSSEEEKTFNVSNNLTNKNEQITVPAHSGIRGEINHSFDTAGTYNVCVTFTSDDDKMTSSASIDITRKPPTEKEASAIQKDMVKKAAQIKELLDKCAQKNISTDYETADYMVMERFAKYTADDIDMQDLSRIYYTEECLNELYEKIKEKLNAYLAEEQTPFIVPHYITSDVTFKNRAAYALNEVDGKLEERPTFFVGYGHFETIRDDIPVLNEFGINAIQNEIGPNQALNVSNWKTEHAGGGDGLATSTTENVKEGERAFFTSYSLPVQANRYTTTYYTLTVEGGRTYELKGWAKAKNASEAWISANNFDDRISLDGTYDWREFKTTYTAPSTGGKTVIRILTEGTTEELYLDGITFTDLKTGENILPDGDFENYDTNTWVLNMNEGSNLDQYCKMLESAEENNVSVCVLISPHYFFNDIIEKYNIGINGGFFKYNVNAPIAREIIEQYVKQIIPVIRNYKSVSSICITNEPHLWVDTAADNFYLEPWREFLSEEYGGDITKLNSVWNTNYTSFDECDFSNYMLNIAKHYDYKKFNDTALASFHIWLANLVKEEAPDIPVHAKIMNYIGDRPLGRSNDGSGYLYNYKPFDLNGCDAFNYVDDNMGHLQKIMWYDYMSSYMDAPVINTEDHISADGNLDFRRDAADYMSQDIYQGAIHGRFMSTIWVWERYTQTSSPDFIGSILYRPDAIAKISKANLDLNRLSYQIEALQNEIPEVGIIYSDADLINNTPSTHASYQAYAAAMFSGKAARFVTDANPNAIFNYKLVIVPGSKYISEEMLNAIGNYVDNGGNLIIMGEDDNILSMDKRTFAHDKELVNHIKNNSTVVDYKGTASSMLNMQPEEFHSIVRDKLKELGMYYVSVVDTATGEAANDIEYNLGVENGKVIVNLSNYDETKNVRVYLGDNLVEKSFELRSGKELGEVITVEKFVPITLEIEADNVFFDTYGHWSEEYVTDLYKKGIISGKSESRYDPNGKTTRAEFLALLTRAAGFEGEEYNGELGDVKADDWYAQNVAVAIKEGIIDQASDFRPNDNITREEMCEMLVKCYEVKNGVISQDGNTDFADNDTIENKTAVSKAVAKGLMQGRDDRTFGAKDFASRAESSTVISKFLG